MAFLGCEHCSEGEEAASFTVFFSSLKGALLKKKFSWKHFALCKREDYQGAQDDNLIIFIWNIMYIVGGLVPKLRYGFLYKVANKYLKPGLKWYDSPLLWYFIPSNICILDESWLYLSLLFYTQLPNTHIFHAAALKICCLFDNFWKK